MKLSEFKQPAKPAAPPAVEVSEPSEEPQGTTTVTPSGIEIEYQWAPRRLYRLRYHYNDWNEKCREKGYDAAVIENPSEWREVPSVTTVLGVLDKSGPLSWWSQGIGVEGVLELIKRGRLQWVEA